LCPIDAVGEDDVARMLGESAIFLSTCQSEGFGLPPLEAAACGCIVIGYTGEAAKQFMLPEYCFPIEQGNILLLAATLERVIKEYENDPTEIIAQAMRFSLHARNKYSKAVEKKGVVEAWTLITAAKQAATS
jgi:glycosyltransferase involved in cell wall biosynthesis